MSDPAMPFHTKLAPPEWYGQLDPGIRFAVRVLHAHGVETGQSCEGGPGHSYAEPTVDLWGDSTPSAGFAALHCLEGYGLHVVSVALHWRVERGLPVEHFWRVTLRQPVPERADESPTFVWGVQAQPLEHGA